MFNKSHYNEVKQEGAVEASQDPNSSVSAGDAERTIMNESKKGGAPVYEFNPDASPEEKAAQAKSRVPEGFHHQHKPNAMGIASDVDDGTGPQYDLPSPTKAGAVGLPKSSNGSIHSRAPLGEDEDARWARDRTGWGPRFGYGDPADDEGANLLEHQTWLESKLDDKWFGDWYYNAGIIIFACLSVHVVSILGGGLFSVFIIMAFCATYYRTSLRRVRRNFRDDVHREMAKGRLETDTESLEWINSFLVKFWPIYAPVLCDTIIASVDQVLSTSTPAFLDSLRMKMFTLGTKPPRLDHVKTYPKTEEDTVLMDWKFSFNPNDTADMTARQLKNKINPKVVLEVRLGKGVLSKGLDVIVEDMAFAGLMRVKVKLQIPFPHIERVDICFLGRPTIDYVCKPLGGDTFGFDINFVPGLESFIQEQIHGNLAPIMYEPNVFPIEIAKMLAGNTVDQAIGVLQIQLHGGEGLRNPDKFPGIPDPYALFSINGRETLGRSKTIKENANPTWNETINIIVTSLKDTLHIQVFDWNEFRKDKDLGTAVFALDQLEEETVHEHQQLEVTAGGKARGIVKADIRFFPLLEGTKNADGTMEPAPESNTGIARFTVEQAKELDGSKSLVGQLNPYAVLLLNGKEVQVSQKLKRTNNPIWPDAMKESLITDKKSAKLGLVIKDDRGITADPIVGTYQIKLNDMEDLMSKGQEWYNLAGVKTGRAKMMLQWKPVALKGGVSSGGYVKPIGVMRFHFQSARELRNLETMGKSDPYVRVLLSGVQKARTVTFQNNLDPDFDEVLYVPIHTIREKLTVEVMDQETMGADRSLGLIDLPASEYVVQGEDGEYMTHEEKRQRSDPLKLAGKGMPKGTLNFTCAFYPTYDVEDPIEEEEAAAQEKTSTEGRPTPNGTPKKSLDSPRPRAETTRTTSNISQSRSDRSGTISSLKPTESQQAMARQLAEGEKEQGEVEEVKTKASPSIKLASEDLSHYESGLIVFKLLDADLAQKDCYVEVLMDDMLFPSYTSSKVRSKQMKFDETGDAIVRELDVSRITLRLRERIDRKNEGKEDHIHAKLTGQTIDVLRNGLYRKNVLTMKSDDGRESHITVELKYIPIKMRLDPSESINNMGTLRVEIYDGADLPAADRNGYSDPYCKFMLNGKQVHKTEVQKKTLHPAWNERFDVAIKSRIAANFMVECWDWDRGGGDDHLGSAEINLNILEPFQTQQVTLGLDGKSGSVRLNMLFKPDYVIRSRQGSSTFQGTFAVPGKVIGAPVKGVGKGAVFVGGNVLRGATFVGRGFRRRKTDGGGEEVIETTEDAASPPERKSNVINSFPPSSTPSVIVNNNRDSTSGPPPQTPTPTSHHRRVPSTGAASTTSAIPSGADVGTATFAVVSASGFDGSNIRVFVRQHTPKGQKEVHKTKIVKLSGTDTRKVQWDPTQETFKVTCPADAQFGVQVKDVHTFGADADLGEGMLVVPDATGAGAGVDKTVHCGHGTVVVRSSFAPSAAGAASPVGASAGVVDGAGLSATPSPARGVSRRFLSKSPRESRQSTPAE